MVYDICVVGNGLIGAAVAAELSTLSVRVMLIGAWFGSEGAVFSSHQDDSRMVREFHEDAYWTRLARRNHEMLATLMKVTGYRICSPMPVIYKFRAKPTDERFFDERIPPLGDLSLAGDHMVVDQAGGVLHPKLYVRALNRVAQQNGVVIKRAVARRIEGGQHDYRIETSAGTVRSRAVVDARGLYSEAADRECSVVGKFVTVFEGVGCADSIGFVDMVEDDLFQSVYGFLSYRSRRGRSRSKFGFTERHSVILRGRSGIREWFNGGYLQHPVLGAAIDRVAEYTRRELKLVSIKPCAFSRSSDGRLAIVRQEGLISVAGCNGLAAKCCQAVAERVVSMLDGIPLARATSWTADDG
jgi:glycine/D-amino acid oxidase-like deaminating enzyme